MQLRALPLLWRDTTEIQVGTDPRWSVALTDLSPAAARALVGLAAGATVRGLTGALRAEGVPAREVDAVVTHLRVAHLIVSASADDPLGPNRADARTLALLALDGDAAPVLARRGRAVVRVSGLGRTGAGLAAVLATAGVGTLHLDDARPTRPEDVGFGGVANADVGRPRAAAVARAVLDARPEVRTVALVGRPADLVVLVEHDVADPVVHAPLLDAGQAHLSVVIGEASIRVGPLVIPGRTACLRCVDLHRTDADPRWPTVAAQLAADRTRGSRSEETTLAVMAAASATSQVLTHIDGRPAATHDGAVEISLPLGLPVLQHWAPHPACGCGAQLPSGIPEGSAY